MQKIKVAFVVNGSRNLNSNVRDLISLCEKEPLLSVQKHFTTRTKEAIQLAEKCSQEEVDYIVAVGGDGTVNEVLNGMMNYIGKKAALAIVPNGTGNDFLKGTKFPLNFSNFIRAIKEQSTNQIDIAQLNTSSETHYFINIADVGFGGKVVQILGRQRSFIGGKISYSLAILRAFITYRKPLLEIYTSDFHFKGPVLMIAICNGSVFGNGLTINPFAKINDGKLNITLLGRVTLIDYVRNLTKLKLGKQIVHPEAKYLETESITIKVIKGNAVSEMDGEYLKEANIEISILKNALRLLEY